jgi:pimeloyl-ACP methyl ester carboxylesterase
MSRRRPLRALLATLLASASLAPAAAAKPPGGLPPDLKPCRLPGVENEAWCGSLKRALDPSAPGGVQIDIHYAVLPAAARHKKPDPVFFLAGGPGQSAIVLAGPVGRQLARLNTRRDIVLVDQRGTGRSAPLECERDSPTRPLAEQADPKIFAAQLAACRTRLQALPYGDLRRYTTTIAMQDLDGVREKLGAAQLNIVGGSYGTRAALEYQRQFPQRVRRSVIDGVAPPDMVLPASFSPDAQASFDAVLAACEADAACATRYPTLRADWARLLAAPATEVTVTHPVTGRSEQLRLSRDTLLSLVRLPLYTPTLASAVPYAVTEAARGRWEPMIGLSTALMRGRGTALAMGMHLSVVCAEDWPRMPQANDKPGADFGDSIATVYRTACAEWPRGEVPADFYRVPAAPAPMLVLSGGGDPATPPRHGERVAKALGPKARHVVVAQAGHGVMSLPCLRDVIFRFIDAADDAAAQAVDAGCASGVPRPPAFKPVQPEAVVSAGVGK